MQKVDSASVKRIVVFCNIFYNKTSSTMRQSNSVGPPDQYFGNLSLLVRHTADVDTAIATFLMVHCMKK